MAATETGQTCCVLALQAQGKSQIAVSMGEIWLEADRLTEFLDRTIKIPLAPERQAEVEMGPGIVRLKAGGRAVVSAMHPAMFLRGKQASFTDPESGEKVRPGSVPHQIGDFVMAAVNGGFQLQGVDEYTPDAAFAASWPRAANYVGWPMLVVLRLGD